MIKQAISYGKVVENVRSLLGSTVNVSVNLGRNKFETFEGVVSACYPALFTVSPTGKTRNKTSFSYSEVMCGRVQLDICG